ncbi:MAG: hypothetical protein M3O28_02010 [Actinomycetota bacterium]|nr:hypothetical protein [Actinomycetota bacterium]
MALVKRYLILRLAGDDAEAALEALNTLPGFMAEIDPDHFATPPEPSF